MAIKIQSTKDITANGANIVIYGESGIGKTHLISTLDNVLVINSDKGLLTLKRFDIPYVTVNSMNDVDDAYKIAKNGDYKNIVIDSVSEMAESLLLRIKKEDKQKAKDKNKGFDPRPSYLALADRVGAMLRHFRDIEGVNVIFLAKLRKLYDESDDLIGYTPLLPGKVLPDGLPYLTDEVFAYRHDNKIGRYLQTEVDRKWPAKDRSGNLEPKEVNPNLSEIIDRVLSNDSKPKPKLKQENKENGRTTRRIQNG